MRPHPTLGIDYYPAPYCRGQLIRHYRKDVSLGYSRSSDDFGLDIRIIVHMQYLDFKVKGSL